MQKDMLPFNNNRELGNLQKHLSLTPNQNPLSKRHITWNEGWVSRKFMKGQRHKENQSTSIPVKYNAYIIFLKTYGIHIDYK